MIFLWYSYQKSAEFGGAVIGLSPPEARQPHSKILEQLKNTVCQATQRDPVTGLMV